MNIRASVLAAAAVAAALILAPTAAFSASYPDPTPPASQSTPVGDTVTLVFSGYAEGTAVTGTVESPADIAAIVRTAQSATKSATSAGTVAFTVTSNSAVTVTVTATAPGYSTVSSTVTFVPADSDALTGTGAELPTLWLWAAGGALALGGALVVSVATRRARTRELSSSSTR